MNNSFIIALVLLTWLLTGFIPGRPIERKPNRWHAVGFLGQFLFFIDGDKRYWLPFPLPFGFHRYAFEIFYSREVMPNENLEEYPSIDTEGQKIKNHKALPKIDGVDKQIRWVSQKVNRIRKVEIHPYLVACVMPISGFTFYFHMTAKIRINFPRHFLRLDNPFVAFGNELGDAVNPWPAEKEPSWITNTHNPQDEVISKMTTLRIDNNPIEVSVKRGTRTTKVELKRYLNINKGFQTNYSMELFEFSNNIGYDKNVAEILKKRADAKLQIEQKLLEEKAALTRGVVREKEKLDALKNVEVDKERTEKVNVPLIKATGNALKNANDGYRASTLVLGGDTGNTLLTTALAKFLNSQTPPSTTPTGGGTP